MVMRSIDFNRNSFKELAIYRGTCAEDVLIYVLRQEGYYVTVTADIRERGKNGAPGMSNGQGDFISNPDLLIALRGHVGWVEVKFKSVPSPTGMTGNRLEHGVGIRKMRHYFNVQNKTGLPVILFLREGSTGQLLYNDIDSLLPGPWGEYHTVKRGEFRLWYRSKGDKFPVARFYYGNKMDPGGMVYFPRDAFKEWGKVVRVDEGFYEQLQLPLFELPDNEGENLFVILEGRNGR